MRFPQFCRARSFSSSRATSRNCSATTRSSSETLGDRHPKMVEMRTAMEKTENTLNAEIARVVESVRTTYQKATRRRRDIVRGARDPEARSAGTEPAGHRVLGAPARGRERPAHLQHAAAASEGNRRVAESCAPRISASSIVPKCPGSPVAPRSNVHHADVVAVRNSSGDGSRVPVGDAGRSPQGSRRCDQPSSARIAGTRSRKSGREQPLGARAAQMRRACSWRRSVCSGRARWPRCRGRRRNRSWSRARPSAKARAPSRASWRLRSRRRSTASCSSTRTCGARRFTNCWTSRLEPGLSNVLAGSSALAESPAADCRFVGCSVLAAGNPRARRRSCWDRRCSTSCWRSCRSTSTG